MRTIESSQPGLKEELENIIASTAIETQYFKEYPTVHYLSGILEFDSFLQGNPFSETNSLVTIKVSANVIFLHIENPKKELFVAYWHKNLKDIKILSNQKIKIRNKNGVSSLLSTGSFGLFGVIAGGVGQKLQGVNAKTVTGSIYEFHFVDEKNQDCIIVFTSPDENVQRTNKFIKKAFPKNNVNLN